MKVQLYSGEHAPQWDDFVAASNNGTIFHRLRFLQYHPPERFRFHHLAFRDDRGRLVAVLPGGLRDGTFVSPCGASYGSFVTGDASLAQWEELVDALLQYGKEQGFAEIALTPPPLPYRIVQNEIEAYVLAYKGFTVGQHLISNITDLGGAADAAIAALMDSSARRAVRKSEKLGVTVRESDRFDQFYPMLVENKKKFGLPPTHTLDELIRLRELLPESIKLLMAYDADERPIAAVLAMPCNPRVVLLFYIAHYFEYQELRAVNRLFYEALRWAKNRGHRYVDFGVSQDTSHPNPMEPSRSLISFKEGAGSRGYLRTTWRYTFER